VATGAAGAALGASLGLPAVAGAQADPAAPRPIPGGLELEGQRFHVFAPSLLGPPDAEPSTITDFSGFVGLAFVRGTGMGRDTATGATRPLLFDVDMRFMDGLYVAADGRQRRGTFGFVWLDLYEGQVDPEYQVHDYSPGITESGLFWTIPLPGASVAVDFARATASLRATNLAVPDYQTIGNALFGEAPPVPATVSFDVRWGSGTQRTAIQDAAQGRAGEYLRAAATIEWSAQQAGFAFRSDPAATSTTTFAVLWQERNGVFARPGGLPRTGQGPGLPRTSLPLGAALALAGIALSRRSGERGDR
jgi:hypothetical protein